MNRRTFALAALATLAGTAGGAGCSKPRTPEAAFARLQGAVKDDSPGALFDALDKRTRWAWMTVQKSHREAYDIILSNYPEGQDRERALRRFERGATLGSARELFIEEVGRATLAKLPHPLPDAVRFDLESSGDAARAVLPSQQTVALRRGPDGSWGYAALADDAEERQTRALGDVEMVRTSAADYERAAARNGR